MQRWSAMLYLSYFALLVAAVCFAILGRLKDTRTLLVLALIVGATAALRDSEWSTHDRP